MRGKVETCMKVDTAYGLVFTCLISVACCFPTSLSAQAPRIDILHPRPGSFWYGRDAVIFRAIGSDSVRTSELDYVIRYEPQGNVELRIKASDPTSCLLIHHEQENYSEGKCLVQLGPRIDIRSLQIEARDKSFSTAIESPRLRTASFLKTNERAVDYYRDHVVQIDADEETIAGILDNPSRLRGIIKGTGTREPMPIKAIALETLEEPTAIYIYIGVDISGSVLQSEYQEAFSKGIMNLLAEIKEKTEGEIEARVRIRPFEGELLRDMTNGYTPDLETIELNLNVPESMRNPGRGGTDVNASIRDAVASVLPLQELSFHDSRYATAAIIVTDGAQSGSDLWQEMTEEAIRVAADRRIPIHWLKAQGIQGDSSISLAVRETGTGRPIDLNRAAKLLPKLVTNSLLGRQLALIVPQIPQELTPTEQGDLRLEFAKRISSGNSRIELWLENEWGGRSSVRLTYPERLNPLSRLQRSVAVLENPEELVMPRFEALLELESSFSDLERLYKGEAASWADTVFTGFELGLEQMLKLKYRLVGLYQRECKELRKKIDRIDSQSSSGQLHSSDPRALQLAALSDRLAYLEQVELPELSALVPAAENKAGPVRQFNKERKQLEKEQNKLRDQRASLQVRLDKGKYRQEIERRAIETLIAEYDGKIETIQQQLNALDREAPPIGEAERKKIEEQHRKLRAKLESGVYKSDKKRLKKEGELQSLEQRLIALDDAARQRQQNGATVTVRERRKGHTLSDDFELLLEVNGPGYQRLLEMFKDYTFLDLASLLVREVVWNGADFGNTSKVLGILQKTCDEGFCYIWHYGNGESTVTALLGVTEDNLMRQLIALYETVLFEHFVDPVKLKLLGFGSNSAGDALYADQGKNILRRLVDRDGEDYRQNRQILKTLGVREEDVRRRMNEHDLNGYLLGLLVENNNDDSSQFNEWFNGDPYRFAISRGEQDKGVSPTKRRLDSIREFVRTQPGLSTTREINQKEELLEKITDLQSTP